MALNACRATGTSYSRSASRPGSTEVHRCTPVLSKAVWCRDGLTAPGTHALSPLVRESKADSASMAKRKAAPAQPPAGQQKFPRISHKTIKLQSLRGSEILVVGA